MEIKNTVEHDIIVLIRDQYRKYARHVYIRNGERFTLKNLPITRIYVQFKSLEFYFEDKKVSVINFGEKKRKEKEEKKESKGKKKESILGTGVSLFDLLHYNVVLHI